MKKLFLFLHILSFIFAIPIQLILYKFIQYNYPFFIEGVGSELVFLTWQTIIFLFQTGFSAYFVLKCIKKFL
jgi:hypothetical protein